MLREPKAPENTGSGHGLSGCLGIKAHQKPFVTHCSDSTMRVATDEDLSASWKNTRPETRTGRAREGAVSDGAKNNDGRVFAYSVSIDVFSENGR